MYPEYDHFLPPLLLLPSPLLTFQSWPPTNTAARRIHSRIQIVVHALLIAHVLYGLKWSGPADFRRSHTLNRRVITAPLLPLTPRQLISFLHIMRHALWCFPTFFQLLPFTLKRVFLSFLVSFVSQKTSCIKSNKPKNSCTDLTPFLLGVKLD